MQADRGIGPSSAADGQIQDIAALTLARDLRELPLAQRQAPMSATTWRSTLGLPTAAHGPPQGEWSGRPEWMRFARLIHRAVRILGGPAVRAASGGHRKPALVATQGARAGPGLLVPLGRIRTGRRCGHLETDALRRSIASTARPSIGRRLGVLIAGAILLTAVSVATAGAAAPAPTGDQAAGLARLGAGPSSGGRASAPDPLVRPPHPLLPAWQAHVVVRLSNRVRGWADAHDLPPQRWQHKRGNAGAPGPRRA
jgi:hypothetical protein